jgi:serine/threonine protein phosphatase PrpC
MTEQPKTALSAALRYDAASAQSLGDRDRQEDALAVSLPEGAEFGFAIVSDGMGGHAAGDLASRIIVAEVFAELILRSRSPVEAAEDLSDLLADAVDTANASLRAQIEACPEQNGMGGTVVATALAGGGLQWASVGDSVLYLLRDGGIERLNDDHSMAPEIDMMVERGVIDAETARTHPQRNCLTSALTGQAIPEVDCPAGRVALRAGDVVLIASDGLATLDEARIAGIVAGNDGRESRDIAAALIEAVAERAVPEQDNTSVVVIRVEAPAATAFSATAPEAPGIPAPAEAPTPQAVSPEVVSPAHHVWSAFAGAFRRPPVQAAAAAKPRS